MVLALQTQLAVAKIRLRNKREEEKRSRYANDPVGWIKDRAGGFMYHKTIEIATSVLNNRRTVVKACHSAGKSWLAARLACWWLDSNAPGDAFVVTTAPTGAQVRAVLWKEIRRVHTYAGLAGRTNQVEWWMNNEMVAFGRKPSDYNETAFQGIHAIKILVILDEGCGIPKELFIAANSLASNEYGRMFTIGNPDDPDTYFAEICKPGSGWNVVTISAFDTPNFTGIDAPQRVKDSLISPIYVHDMKNDVGEDSGVYKSKVLGEFPDNKVDGVIPLGWLLQCQDKESISEYGPMDLLPVELGVDVGAGGDDTSIRCRRGILASEALDLKTPTPEEAYVAILMMILQTNATKVKIDVIGLGWGLLGMLNQTKLNCAGARNGNSLYFDELASIHCDISNVDIVGVNVGQAATDPTRFPRLRDQLWWEVGRGLSHDKGWNLALVDDETIEELSRPTWKPDLANRHRVETKLEMMNRTHKPSPNRADAILLAYCEPPRGPQEQLIVYHDPVTIGPEY